MRTRVLLIDDEADFAFFMRHNLELTGKFEVKTAANGSEGLRSAAKFSPDVILLDIRMPGMNGFEVLRKLKQHGKTEGIPVIMLTALDDEKSKVMAANLYNEAYVTKPITTADLAARIEMVMDRCGPSWV